MKAASPGPEENQLYGVSCVNPKFRLGVGKQFCTSVSFCMSTGYYRIGNSKNLADRW